MDDTSPAPVGFDQFMAAFVQGTSTAEEFAQLNAILRAEPARRRQFVSVMVAKRGLAEIHAQSEAADAAIVDQLMHASDDSENLLWEVLAHEQDARRRRARLETPGSVMADGLPDRGGALPNADEAADVPVRYVIIPKPLFYTVIGAAAAMVLLFLSTWFRPDAMSSRDASTSAPPELASANGGTFATVVETRHARWSGEAAFAVGERLADGPVTLDDGLVRLAFANEAQVIVQGPATIESVGPDTIRLHRGRLVGLCTTERSRGFRVLTPGARVVDLGTEFGVAVDEFDATEAHVFTGLVRVMPRAEASRHHTGVELRSGESRRINAAGTRIRVAAVDPLSFVRAEEFDARQLADSGSTYHRWLAHAYDMARDPNLLAHYRFDDHPATGVVVNHAPRTLGQLDGIVAPMGEATRSWTHGRWAGKGAMRFNPVAIVIDDWSQHVPERELTVAAWVRVERDQPWNPIVTQWSDEWFGFHLALAGPGNAHDDFGPRLTLHMSKDGTDRITMRDEHRDGGTTHADGQWVHVAFTAAAHGGRVRLYKNGREVDTESDARFAAPFGRESVPLMIGGRVGKLRFSGVIDEVLILDRVLAPQEIEHLYQIGTP